MLKRNLLVFLVLCLAVPVLVQAADKKKSDSEAKKNLAAYQAEISYPGIYRSHRLYQLRETQVWYASRRHKVWATLPCLDARESLTREGEWSGVLTEDGRCAGYVEAPRWAAGNFLNYRIYKKSSARKNK